MSQLLQKYHFPMHLAVCEQVTVEITFVKIPDMNNVLSQGLS